jgi:hypothetical protein
LLNNISLSVITSDFVDDSVDLVLPDAAIVTVTDDEHVEDHERHKHEHAESPQSRSWTHRLILPPRPSDPPSPLSPPPSSSSSSCPPAGIVWNSRLTDPPTGRTMTGRVSCRSSSRVLRVLLLLRLRLRLSCRRRLHRRPPPRRGRHRPPIPPNASPPSPPSPHRHHRHFQHRHRPAPPALQAHIYPCTNNNSCIACHFKGCRISDDAAADSGRGVSLDLFFLGFTAHLLDEDSIGSFRIRVPFCALITAGMESLVTGFGSQARKKRAAFLAWVSTLYSFLFEDIARIERELGLTDAEAPEKGKQLW